MKSSMLCVSGGINPDIHLFTQSKGLVKWDEKLLTFKPDTPFQNTITLGSVSGNYDYEKTNEENNNKSSDRQQKAEAANATAVTTAAPAIIGLDILIFPIPM